MSLSLLPLTGLGRNHGEDAHYLHGGYAYSLLRRQDQSLDEDEVAQKGIRAEKTRIPRQTRPRPVHLGVPQREPALNQKRHQAKVVRNWRGLGPLLEPCYAAILFLPSAMMTSASGG